MSKQSMLPPTHTNLESYLYWPTTPEHKAYSVTWLMYPKSLHWKKLILPLVEAIKGRWFLGWKWNFVLPSSFSCWEFCLS